MNDRGRDAEREVSGGEFYEEQRRLGYEIASAMPATSTTETTAAAASPNNPATMRRRILAQDGNPEPERALAAARVLSSLLDSLTRWPASRGHYRNRPLPLRPTEAFVRTARRGSRKLEK